MKRLMGTDVDWSENPSGHYGTPIGVPMLWGAGHVDGQDYNRLAGFRALSFTPPYIIGFEEPDCASYGSAGFDVGTGEFEIVVM